MLRIVIISQETYKKQRAHAYTLDKLSFLSVRWERNRL
jgi:hypothetical protein